MAKLYIDGFPFRFGPAPCCCPGGCWYFKDNFNRDDSTFAGLFWNEVTGKWGIEDEELVEEYTSTTGTSNAILFCTQAEPEDSAGEQWIKVEIPLDSVEDGDVYSIWPCCPDTSITGDIEVQFSYSSSPTPTWTITILGGPGGPASVYSVPLTGYPTNVTLHVCADHDANVQVVRGWVSPTANEWSAWEKVDPGDGRHCAIGHNNTGHQNRFDNFEFWELRDGNVICKRCFCVCDNYGMPTVLTATITNATDRAECLEGESWEMEVVLGPQTEAWEGCLEKANYYDVDYLCFRLVCGNQGPESFCLYPMEPYGCVNSELFFCADPDLSTCDPLALYFGPYSLDFAMDCGLCYGQMEPPGCVMPDPPDDCFGKFWIVITL